jgi:hypothetical protein
MQAVDVAAADLDASRGALARSDARHVAARRRAEREERARIQRERAALLTRFAPALDRLVRAAVAADAAVTAIEGLCREDCGLAGRIDETGLDVTVVRLAAQLRLGCEFMPPTPRPANLSAFRAAHAAVLQPGTPRELLARASAAREELIHSAGAAQLADWVALPSRGQRWDDGSPHAQRVAAAERLLRMIDAATAEKKESDDDHSSNS